MKLSNIQRKAVKWMQEGIGVHPLTCDADDRGVCPDRGTLSLGEEEFVCPCGLYKQSYEDIDFDRLIPYYKIDTTKPISLIEPEQEE